MIQNSATGVKVISISNYIGIFILFMRIT